jgi:hypothetical protein
VHVALGEVAAAGVEWQAAARRDEVVEREERVRLVGRAKKSCSIRLMSTPPVKFS